MIKISKRRGRAFRTRPTDYNWICVGTYANPEDAAKAYDVLLRRYDLGGGLHSYQLKQENK